MNKKIDTHKKDVNYHPEGLREEIEAWRGKYLRALADYQNLERRVNQDWEEQRKLASRKIIQDILGVFDTLEKADKHLKDPGLTLGVKSFWSVLEANGVKKIEVLGKKFDPQLMECVEVVEGGKDGEVIEEVRAGYMVWDRVIRVAQVKVGKKNIERKAEELAKEELRKGDYM
jgi:molecular chaperone GrpE